MALGQRIMEPLERDVPTAEPFTGHDLLEARPALLLDVQMAGSEEFAGRLISFAGHDVLALQDEPPT